MTYTFKSFGAAAADTQDVGVTVAPHIRLANQHAKDLVDGKNAQNDVKEAVPADILAHADALDSHGNRAAADLAEANKNNSTPTEQHAAINSANSHLGQMETLLGQHADALKKNGLWDATMVDHHANARVALNKDKQTVRGLGSGLLVPTLPASMDLSGFAEPNNRYTPSQDDIDDLIGVFQEDTSCDDSAARALRSRLREALSFTQDDIDVFSQQEFSGNAGDEQTLITTFGKWAGGSHKTCVRKLSGKVDDPERLCAWMKDRWKGNPYWRGKSDAKGASETFADKVTKTEGGKDFSADDYAYAPDPQTPSTWKLRLVAVPGGDYDAGIVGAAIAALGPGFRGQKVDIPAADLPAVRRKVLAAWRKLNPDAKSGDVPKTLQASEDLRAFADLSFDEIQRKLIAALNPPRPGVPTGAMSDDMSVWPQAVYDGYCIYGMSDGKLYRCDYNIDDSGALTLDTPQEVREDKSYVPVTASEWYLFNEIQQYAEAPEWIPYLPVPGNYSHPKYGKVKIDRARNQRFVKNFTDGVYQPSIPIDAEHNLKLSGALGWIVEMRENPDGSADARVNWTDRGREMIEADRFRYFSPEWFEEWEDPMTGQKYNDVPAGGALVVRPFFKHRSLRPIVASEGGAMHAYAEETIGEDGASTVIIRFEAMESQEFGLVPGMHRDAHGKFAAGKTGGGGGGGSKGEHHAGAIDIGVAVGVHAGRANGHAMTKHSAKVGADVAKQHGMPYNTRKPVSELHAYGGHAAREMRLANRKSTSVKARAGHLDKAEGHLKKMSSLLDEHRQALQSHGLWDRTTAGHHANARKALKKDYNTLQHLRSGGSVQASERLEGDLVGDLDKLDEQIEQLEEETGDMDNEPNTASEMVEMSESARLQFDEMQRQLSEATRQLGELQTERRRAHFTDIVLGRGGDGDGVRFFGEPEKHVAMLEFIADHAPEGENSDRFREYVNNERAHSEQMRTSQLFSSNGTRQVQPSGAWDRIVREAEKLRTDNPKMTEDQAISSVLDTNSELYSEYISEQQRGPGR